MPRPRSYVPTIADTYAFAPSVNAVIDGYAYEALVDDVIGEIDAAAGFLDPVEAAGTTPAGLTGTVIA